MKKKKALVSGVTGQDGAYFVKASFWDWAMRFME